MSFRDERTFWVNLKLSASACVDTLLHVSQMPSFKFLDAFGVFEPNLWINISWVLKWKIATWLVALAFRILSRA